MTTQTTLEVLFLRIKFRALLFRGWRHLGVVDVDRAFREFEFAMAQSAPVA